jgi:hypothetical protein
MIYEYRRYEVNPGRLRDVHRRFEELTLPLWTKHGIEALGFWEVVVGDSNQLHYLLRWKDLSDRDGKWTAFVSDQEWLDGFAKSEASGPLVARIHNEFWRPTSYSALK